MTLFTISFRKVFYSQTLPNASFLLRYARRMQTSCRINRKGQLHPRLMGPADLERLEAQHYSNLEAVCSDMFRTTTPCTFCYTILCVIPPYYSCYTILCVSIEQGLHSGAIWDSQMVRFNWESQKRLTTRNNCDSRENWDCCFLARFISARHHKGCTRCWQATSTTRSHDYSTSRHLEQIRELQSPLKYEDFTGGSSSSQQL